MQNIKLTLQYDGTRYLGWKRPEKEHPERTVSYRLESVLTRLTGAPVTLYAGTRTEPGVHARHLTVNFLTESPLSPTECCTALNQYLPQDIAVLDASVAPERFRSDLGVKGLVYEYVIDTLPVYDLFQRNYRYHMDTPPDIEQMNAAIQPLLGKHDFRHFSSIRKKKGTVKELWEISFSQDDSALHILIAANDVLYQMVPFLLGTLLEVGTRKRPAGCMETVLNGTEKPSASCDTKGLFLTDVLY